MQIVRGQQRRTELLRDLKQVLRHLALDLEIMVHQLNEEIVFAIDVLQLTRRTQGLIELTEAQTGLHNA